MAKTKSKSRKPKYRLTLLVRATNIKTVEAKLKQLFEVPMEELKITKIDLPNSRQERLDDCRAQVEGAAVEVETLKDELQDWFDALPDSFQQGEQGDNLNEAINGLGDLQSELEGIDFSSFTGFPGMRG